MQVAVIDADLIGRKAHRFPNLACMKLSSYWKKQGAAVTLKRDYDNLSVFDMVFVSKVFTDTPCPEEVLSLPNVQFGGTGFFYDKASPLPHEIEHAFPDYHLYDEFVEAARKEGVKPGALKYYTDYSIGFMTRGCFRKCAFCVNQNYSAATAHSPLSEFYDPARPKVCLLDDNFLACNRWKELLLDLRALRRPFQFKQGLDERLLTPHKCELLFSSKYDSAYIFAFDNVADAPVIEEKLKLIRQYSACTPVFYVFCGFDRNNKWDSAFWLQDLRDIWTRLKILGAYGCSPYIMRYARYEESPYRKTYIDLARWCNQFSFFKKMSFWDFCQRTGRSSKASIEKLLQDYPEFASSLSTIYFKKGGTK